MVGFKMSFMTEPQVIGFIDLAAGKHYPSRQDYELEKIASTMAKFKSGIQNAIFGCPHCGSYEGDAVECSECGYGQ